MRRLMRFFVPMLMLGLAMPCVSADWPMWRFDETRRAVAPEGLARELHLQWTRELPAPQRAWHRQLDDADKLEFDVSYEPIVANGKVFVSSMVTDSLTAYDAATGNELWDFQANGPMRFAPVFWEGKVYAGSDDGYLYCLDAQSGRMLWKSLGGPEERWMLGNERLINVWPVRGGPVIRDGTIYFAAGIWPFMGIFIHALDAQTGEVVWSNTGTGALYNLHQHGGAFAFGGVSPQGYLAATEDKLIVPGGRTVPAVFDRRTGELMYFQQASDYVGKGRGGYRVWVQGDWFFNHGPPVHEHSTYMYSLDDGAQFTTLSADIASEHHLIGIEGNQLRAFDPVPQENDEEIKNRLKPDALKARYSLAELWEHELSIPLTKIHLQAGDRLYASGPEGQVAAIDLPKDGQTPAISWQATVDGEVWRMLAADEKLFVVTVEGGICCFGPEQRTPAEHPLAGRPEGSTGLYALTQEILRQSGRSGYALMLGAGSGRLLDELLRQSELRIIVIEPDEARVRTLRRHLTEERIYGRRASVIHGQPFEMKTAPYLASLIVSEDAFPSNAKDVETVFGRLRPYGGTACFVTADSSRTIRLSTWSRIAKLENARVRKGDGFIALTREGALPGAGSWTHQYSDCVNTNFSPDELARAPMGVLWFGGESNHNLLPRHNNGPVPQVVGGQMFLLGRNTISSRDVYTGRQVWIVDLPGVGEPFTTAADEEKWKTGEMVYFSNHPGANFIGSPYVSLSDGIYVKYGEVCLRLDPATGRKISEFRLPKLEADGVKVEWGHIRVCEDLLVAGAKPQFFDDALPGRDKSWNATSSEWLVIMNRHSGKVLWTRKAHYGFRHNAIIAANGRVFAIDGLSLQALEMAQRRGAEWNQPPTVYAFDARTGKPIWSMNGDTFGTWLSYSEEHDILLQSGRHGARQPLSDEPRERMVAHRGANGEVLWERSQSYSGPIGIRGEMIITAQNQPAINLLTGEDFIRVNPITGEEMPWSFRRSYGCGTQNLSAHLITFRSGAAGYFDLANDGGTGNFGGIKAGCTNNLVAGDGVLCASDYTRSCTCSYQLQTSAAFVHMPDAEMWTYVNFPRGKDRVRALGVNFGAPGARMGDDGVFWIDYPNVGGPAPEVPVSLSNANLKWFHKHSLLMNSGEVPWVGASGFQGATNLTLALGPLEEDKKDGQGDGMGNEVLYTVSLHFSEPDDVSPGDRVFNVSLQGKEILASFDVVSAAGGSNRAVVREFTGISVGDVLHIELTPVSESKLPPVLCGLDVRIAE